MGSTMILLPCLFLPEILLFVSALILIIFSLMLQGSQARMGSNTDHGGSQQNHANLIHCFFTAADRFFINRFLQGAMVSRRQVPYTLCSHDRP